MNQMMINVATRKFLYRFGCPRGFGASGCWADEIGRLPPVRTAAGEWLAEREAELLPVPYFHVVFSLPAQIAEAPPPSPTRDFVPWRFSAAGPRSACRDHHSGGR